MGNCVASKCVPPGKKTLSPEKAKPLPKPKPQAAPGTTDAEGGTLKVQTVDMCFGTNGPSHHTHEYDLMEKLPAAGGRLVVRRGQPFTIKITFDRIYDSQKDKISIVFSYKGAKNPSYSQNTLNVIPLLDGSDMTPEGNWGARVYAKDGNTITVEVTTTAKAMVGQWMMDIDCKLADLATATNYQYPYPIYMLFNPWCPDDQCYMEHEKQRQEYVLTDWGLIWRGSHSRMRPCIWTYGQFELNILDCCLYLLQHVRKLDPRSMTNPVAITRAISSVVNSPDNSGALVGNWSGDYRGGSAPTQWVGSVKILQQFYKTKRSVKFGQCWVFSGIVTTVCRALGIPCRSVTNFSSAHDTHSSLTIDHFFKDAGENAEELNSDSIWNFHVWNEVWMTRPDLEPGDYCGWQAVDATPQELSDGLFRCGPASVKAIKRGEVEKPFDGNFVFAEVNADEIYWRYQGPTQPVKFIAKKTDSVGKHISTKAIGTHDREDLTYNYKPLEKSKEERAAMLRALRQCESSFSRYYLNEELEDIEFSFQLMDDVMIGNPFAVCLRTVNKSSQREYNVIANLLISTILYTGKPHKNVKTQEFNLNVPPNSEKAVRLEVTYNEYYPMLIDQAAFSIVALAKVKETNFEYYAHDDFRVRKPDIQIQSEAHLKIGESFVVKAQFKNPLPIPLTRGQFHFEGPGLGAPVTVKSEARVAAGEDVTASCTMKPRLVGEKTIGVKFTSKELDDVDGYLTVQVKPLNPSVLPE